MGVTITATNPKYEFDIITEYLKEHEAAQAVIRRAMAEGKDDAFWKAINRLME